MIRDVVWFNEVWPHASTSGQKRGIAAFIDFLERRLGGRFAFSGSALPLNEPSLVSLVALAERLLARGDILSYGQIPRLPDEPPLYGWYAQYEKSDGKNTEQHASGGGTSIESEYHALIAAIAETTERRIWTNEIDHLAKTERGTFAQMKTRGQTLDPESFAGFSTAQRASNDKLHLSQKSVYLWVRGHSWTTSAPVWVPAQSVSGSSKLRTERVHTEEPILVHSITHGLATRPTREDAVLHGALELFERDAFMITWLNKLSGPRLDLDQLALQSPTLGALLQQCARYRLRPHVVRLISDAPTYTILGVIEDETGNQPHVAVGLKAHWDAAKAAEGALLEALRQRTRTREQLLDVDTDWDPARTPSQIRHHDRALYWTVEDRAATLAFLYEGPVVSCSEVWDNDTPNTHLKRIVDWCRERRYHMASVSLGTPRTNATPWKIEMVVIPELQPLHISELLPYHGGARLKSVPESAGHTPRKTIFEEPHPFT